MTSASLAAAAGAESRRPRFYVYMAGACMAVAALGFMPTYFLPLAQGRFRAEPIVHIHGLILYSWMGFFFVQSWLVAQGQVLAHRTWGMLGIAIVTAMVFIVTTIVSLRIAQASLPGQPAGAAHDMRAFEWISMGGLVFLTPVFVLAIVNIRRPQAHKRLLLLMTISMLPAPIARWFLTLLAPHSGSPPPSIPGLPDVSEPPPFVAIGPSLVADILLVIAIVYDWRTRGRPHPVYLIGGAVLLLLQLTTPLVAESDAWQSIAAAIGHLAG